MRKWILGAIAFLAFASLAWAQSLCTVTGNIKNLVGATAGGGTIYFSLSNYTGPVYVSGTGVVAKTRVSGTVAADGSFSVALLGNDSLSPANTLYDVRIVSSGGTYEALYSITGSSFNLNTATPTGTPSAPVFANQPVLLNPSTTQTIAGTLNAPTAGNIGLKPAASDAVQYVSINGNDANDGWSMGSAKLTEPAACAALPGGASACSGYIVFGAGTFPLGTVGVLMHSNLHVNGNGEGSTILEITNSAAGIIYNDSGGVSHTSLTNLTIYSTTAAGNTTFIRAHGFNDPAIFSFNDIDVDLQAQTPTAGSAGFFATSDGAANATQIVLNNIRLTGTGIDTPVICKGCEGNYWIVNFYKSGLTNGATLFDLNTSTAGAPSTDEKGWFRGENEAGPIAQCLRVTGTLNQLSIICDSNQTGVKAVDDLGSANMFDISDVGTPTVGTISSLSQYRNGDFLGLTAFSLSSSSGGTITHQAPNTASNFTQTDTPLSGSTVVNITGSVSISSGFGTTPSIVNQGAGSGPTSIAVNVGTGGTATSGVLTMPAAPTGWSCSTVDMNTNIVTRETAFTTTSVTLTAASAWTASDKLLMTCWPF